MVIRFTFSRLIGLKEIIGDRFNYNWVFVEEWLFVNGLKVT